MNWLFAYVALGLFTGLSAGMLGIGGGLVMVPVLAMIFASQSSFPSGDVLHLALGTSAATILFTSLSSLRSHHQHGAVIWKIVAQISPGILLGTVFGASLASAVPAEPLAVIFACFVLFAAVQMVFNLKPKPNRQLPGRIAVVAVGGAIGCISALVAIGGGVLTVPFLTFCNVKMQKAIGTSAAVGFPIALGSTLGYVANGWARSGLPEWCLGFVYLPALAWMVPCSMLMAPAGAKCTHKLPVVVLKRIFAIFLVLLATRMLLRLIP